MSSMRNGHLWRTKVSRWRTASPKPSMAARGCSLRRVDVMAIHIEPRILRKADAARYCGVDPTSFLRVCPVVPVDLGDKVRRWDRKHLDAWLDGLAKTLDTMSGDDWLDRLGHADHGDDGAP